MKIFNVKMPKLGESITEGTIIAWSVKVGDVVKEDDILFEVTTAKVNAEVPSPMAGTVLEILFKEDDTVSVGTVVMVIQIDEEGVQNSDEPTLPNEKAESAPINTKEDKWYSPIVLQLANQAHISTDELNKIQGSGYLGRLSKKDIQLYIAQKQNGVRTPSVAESKPIEVSKPIEQMKPIEQTKPQQAIVTSMEDQIVEMDSVRRIIADHMVASRRTSAHVTTFIEADVTKLVEWRKRTKGAFFKQEGINLTYMPAIVEATTNALKAYPMVNASVDGYRMILKKHINIGIAVALDSGNLIVPVLHNADKLSISGLAQAIDTLANSARAGKLKIEDIEGGTFTITNFGTFRNIMGTPIINQPQVAILGIGYIEKKPSVIETPDGDAIAIRHKIILSLSYDHRIIDGALGGKFLLHIAEYLQNWNQ